ncbi:MAG: hypothetical protein FK733_03185 [Asgard group archaeon]|nr:hypothetical protein [Asgard group archaeon]
MNESENDKSTDESNWNKIDKNYFISAGIGLVVLIVTIVLIHFFRGGRTWLEIFVYPLLIYFIFQQIISGFGFITGYFPIAQGIINWLSKTAKKKEYDPEDIQKLENKLEKIEDKEKKEIRNLANKIEELEKKENENQQRHDLEKLSDRKFRREMDKVNKKKIEITNEITKCENNYSEEKDAIRSKLKGYRGKFSEKIIAKQEDLELSKFKLIMLVPIYVMTILGVVLSIVGMINPIIRWAEGTPIPALDTADRVTEIYKGIMAIITIITIYIIPAVRGLRDPSKFFVVRHQEVDTRRRFLFFRFGKKKDDNRTILNRQFEELRKYFWDIKILIRRALFAPMGLSMLIAAPIGGMSVYMGIRSSVSKREFSKMEWIIFIVISAAIICLVAPTYFSFFAKFIKEGIHPSIAIIIKIIYIAFLIYAFVLFTRQPVARIREKKQ